MMVLASEPHDRMRAFTPIGDETTLQDAPLRILMEANFDRALDARYAIFQNRLYSVYLHPLSSLTKDQLANALDQVATLAQTYGTTYSSSSLQFRPSEEYR